MKKTLIFVIAAFAALTASSYAQVAGPAGGAPPATASGEKGRGGHGANLKRMQEAIAKLNLTDAQKGQVKDLFGKAQVARKEFMQKVKSGALSREQARPEMMKMAKATHDDLMKILTPAQQKELMAAMKQAHKGGKEGRPGKKGNRGNGTPPGTATPPPAN